MEFFKPGLLVDFMRHRRLYAAVSITLVVLSIASLFYPGPNFGIDFRGGTEVQLVFEGDVTSAELREQLEALGYDRPDVVAVTGGEPNEYMIRILDVSSIGEEQEQAVRESIASRLAANDVDVIELRVSDGGDKVRLELSGSADTEELAAALEAAGGHVLGVNAFGPAEHHRYEAQLAGVAQEMMAGLTERLGARGPRMPPQRVEWVGPRAGAQLRDAAIKSLLYAIAFIMVYVAFRFDLRFAPGGVVALLHDSLITLGVFVLLQKEFNLTTIAALLTIIGYSINDTIVVYDRIRENLGRFRERSLYDVINISTSQMLSRTIVTSMTTLISVSAFFIWGTAVIRDISFALFIGILIGTYSSIYVAAPLTEWMDRRFFSRTRGEVAGTKKRRAGRARA